MIDPESILFKWGPIDGRMVYNGYWIEGACTLYPAHKAGFSEMICFFKKDKITVVLDKKDLCDNGERFFDRYVTKRHKNFAFNGWKKVVASVIKFHSELDKTNLARLDKQAFKKTYDEWHKLHLDFWQYGFVVEFANWGGERRLIDLLKNQYPSDYLYLLEKLTAPTKLSFYQQEELDLLKCKFSKNRIEKEKRINEHQKKYYWIQNSYHSTKVLSADFFSLQLKKLSAADAKKKIQAINRFSKNTINKKKEIIKKFKISPQIKKLADNLSYLIWWQDYRKKYIFQLNHYTTIFIKAASRIYKVPVDELYLYTTADLNRLFSNGKKLDKKAIEERLLGFIMLYIPPARIEYMKGKNAIGYICPYISIKINKDKFINGLVVSTSKIVRGKARILFSAKNAVKLKKGEILVAPMTSPEYITAMRKASAVITDEGGLTCHAAIVSRELGIPCIVGTKVATRFLKTGDMIEVDTANGKVTKL